MAKKQKSYCPCCGEQQKPLGKLFVCRKGHEGPMGPTEEENIELAERRKQNRIHEAVNINIQIGDDEGEHEDLFYRLTGVQGNFILKTFHRYEKHNGVDNRFETKEIVEKRYYGTLYQIVDKINTMNLVGSQAATLPELLEVLRERNATLASLEEAIYYVGNNEPEDEEEEA